MNILDASSKKPHLARTVILGEAILALAWLVASCAPQPAITPEQPTETIAALPSAVHDLTFEQLKNAILSLPDAPSGSIKLAGGEGQAPLAPDSASQFNATLLDMAAFGDLDEAGGGDAAAVVVADPGGSGSFYYLVALLNEAGQPVHAASALLGDRIKIGSVSIENGQIRVVYLDRKPGEPFTTEPSQEVTKIFRLKDGQLEEVTQP